MPKQVLMPQLGESVHEGTISKWLKRRGEPIEEYEPLLEVNTDKVDTEVPSPAAGVVLDILVEEGMTVQVGQVLAWIGEAGESSAAAPLESAELVSPPAAAGQAPGLSAAPALGGRLAGRDRELGFISPVVAKIAREQNLDLRQVRGTGLSGRITRQDVLDYLAHPPQPGAAQPAAAQPVPGVSYSPPPAALPGDQLVAHTPVRRAIAEHMVFSRRTSPHVTTVMEADLSRVSAHRQANKDAFARDGANLTFTAYFVAATVYALKTFPLVNSSWSEQGILIHQPINIGMAASLGEAGLIVPVLHHADGLSLLGTARAVNDLANRARLRQLKPDEVKGGTFTITNHGVTGSLFAMPVINQPQCAILGVGAIQKRPVVISDPLGNDAIAIRAMVYLSLTFDHRILDGAAADAFLARVVEYLQNYQ
jgi:2-oxoglutarate dehydrogenase E2 component (dihydrolipoamide succinyltransferase)